MNTYSTTLDELSTKCEKVDWDFLLRYWYNICILKHQERPFFWEIPDHVQLSFGDFLNQINSVGFNSMKVAVKYKGRGKNKSKWYIFAEYKEELNIDHSKKILENDIREILRDLPK